MCNIATDRSHPTRTPHRQVAAMEAPTAVLGRGMRRRQSIPVLLIAAFLAETKLIASLEHERIVRFIGVAWDSLTDLCVVSEFMEGGDLCALLVKFEDVDHRSRGFDHDKIRIAMHTAHALTYLHSLQSIVLHRNLKTKNILLDMSLNAKLTDFGVSRERIDHTMTAGVGSSLWMVPEVMLGERTMTKPMCSPLASCSPSWICINCRTRTRRSQALVVDASPTRLCCKWYL
ncbi:Tkl protein kinase, partial [Globisporangium splendens]